MSDLVRTRCGAFVIEEAVALESLQGPDDIRRHLVPINESLSTMPSVVVGSEGTNSLLAGRSLLGVSVVRRTAPFQSGDLLRVMDREGHLLGIGKALLPSDQITGMGGNLRVVRPIKVFGPN